MTRKPPLTKEIAFDAFFEAGQDEHLSPFLKPESRRWAINLSLKASLGAAAFLILAYLLTLLPLNPSFISLLLISVYFFAGIPSLIESIEDLASFQINIDVLMTLAAFGSLLIGSPFEGALLLVLFSISGAMEEMVTKKAKASISSLHKLAPTTALVLNEEGLTLERSLSEISPKMKILVRAGQVVPLDGRIVEGISSLNLVHLTGENIPVVKKEGDEVAAGSLNLEGALVISVTHTSQDSTLARIIKLVTQAQEAKPHLQRWFDKLSGLYAKTIILLAFLFASSLPFLLNLPFFGIDGSIYRALAFLIAASPCALIIAIPIAYLSAISACAKKGIVLKGGVTLDTLATCQTIAFDKTGTLTTGELLCLGFEPLTPPFQWGSDQALSIALSIEQNATHPIAQAITCYARENRSKPSPISSFRTIAGFGVEAYLEKIPIFLGNFEFIEPKIKEDSNLLYRLRNRIKKAEEEGELIALLLIDKELYFFRFRDEVRKEVPSTLQQLKKSGYHLMMLTGDHLKNAEKVGKELGIEDIRAHLKPEEKLRIVDEESEGKGLAMVGDGINDAPALARATVGISMGKVGSSAAIEAADVVLLQDNVERLDWLMRKAKKTHSIVMQNLFLATLVIFAASIPALLGIVPLWLAVLMHEGGTVLVGLNGLRLLR